MNKQGKAWGETEELFKNGTSSIHILNIKKGGYCSEHHHIKKYNIFYVISGELEVTICHEGDWTDFNFNDPTILTAGERMEIEPGLKHKFEAKTDVICLEIYEVRLEEPDIVRGVRGGLKE